MMSRDVRYCEGTRNIDTMFMIFGQERSKLIQDLVTDPSLLADTLWSEKSPLMIDRECLSQMGQYKNLNVGAKIEHRPPISAIIRRMYQCPQCVNMGRLAELIPFDRSRSFQLECGRDVGKKMILTKDPISVLRLYWSDHPQRHLEALVNEPNMRICEPTLSRLANVGFLGSDSFTNRILVNWYLEYLLANKEMPNINVIYTSFICADHGYNLYQEPTIGSISSVGSRPGLLGSKTYHVGNRSYFVIDKQVIWGIILQLFAVLKVLKDYDFSHGGVHDKALVFHGPPVSYSYDGVMVISPITLKLSELATSGITVRSSTGNVRIYAYSDVAENHISNSPYKPMIETISVTPHKEGKPDYAVYKLISSPTYVKFGQIFMYLQNMGIPLYQSSFDAYSFMVLLMLEPSFFYGLSEHEAAKDLWASMWMSEEFQQVQDALKAFHSDSTRVTASRIVQFLSKFRLRCDVIDLAWAKIKKYQERT